MRTLKGLRGRERCSPTDEQGQKEAKQGEETPTATSYRLINI